MKTASRISKTEEPAPILEVNDWEQLSGQQEIMVEHLTIPGFLRKIPHKWDMDEIARFGAKMGKVADAMQLSFVTTIDRSLGVIRVFPLPLLNRVYTVMSPQFGWPAISPGETDEQREKREALKKTERTSRDLQDIASMADNVELLHALEVVKQFMRDDLARLRREVGDR